MIVYKALNDIGTQIKKLRLASNMSQDDLARISGIDKANISRLENGQSNATVLTLEKIGKALGVSLQDIFKTE